MIPIRGFFLLTVDCSLRTNPPHHRRRTLPGEASAMPFSDSSRVCRSASTAGALFRSGPRSDGPPIRELRIHLPVLFDGTPLSSADGVVGVASKAAPPTFLLGPLRDIIASIGCSPTTTIPPPSASTSAVRGGHVPPPLNPSTSLPRAAPVPRVIPVHPILGLRPPINARSLAQFLVLLPAAREARRTIAGHPASPPPRRLAQSRLVSASSDLFSAHTRRIDSVDG